MRHLSAAYAQRFAKSNAITVSARKVLSDLHFNGATACPFNMANTRAGSLELALLSAARKA